MLEYKEMWRKGLLFSSSFIITWSFSHVFAILNATTRDTSERYKLAQMLRNENLWFPNNDEFVLRHSHVLGRRFKKSSIRRKLQLNQERIYFSMPRHWSSAISAPTRFEWIFPHHGVQTLSKPGKAEVVFNPSARHRGTSLNEQPFKELDLLTS